MKSWTLILVYTWNCSRPLGTFLIMLTANQLIPLWHCDGHLWFRQFRVRLQVCSHGGQLPSQHCKAKKIIANKLFMTSIIFSSNYRKRFGKFLMACSTGQLKCKKIISHVSHQLAFWQQDLLQLNLPYILHVVTEPLERFEEDVKSCHIGGRWTVTPLCHPCFLECLH